MLSGSLCDGEMSRGLTGPHPEAGFLLPPSGTHLPAAAFLPLSSLLGF